MNENNPHQTLLRVAIIHTSNHKPEELGKSLKAHNVDVVTVAELSNRALCEIDPSITDAILVDLDENAEQDLDILENLLEISSLPLLFNDSETTQFNISISREEWTSKLASKLRSLVEKSTENKPSQVVNPVFQPIPNINTAAPTPAPKKVKVLKKIYAAAAAPVPAPAPAPVSPVISKGSNQAAQQVWVLGASLGGPSALREFLANLPEDLPIAFILAQHIGANHIKLLGEQLDRVTPLTVMTAKAGHTLCNNEVVLAPIEKRIVINSEGKIMLSPIVNQSIYSPSIDDVMFDLAETYQSLSGAIIFSGMGNDGEAGSKVITSSGGVIWAQEPESCVISSMPDCARQTGCVSHSNTPEELAEDLVEYLAQSY